MPCVFDSLTHAHIVTWNAIIAGYAQQRDAEKALRLYSQMLGQGIKSDGWKFVSLLEVLGGTLGGNQGTLAHGSATKLEVSWRRRACALNLSCMATQMKSSLQTRHLLGRKAASRGCK